MNIEFRASWSYRARTGYLKQGLSDFTPEQLRDLCIENKEIVFWSRKGEMTTSRVPVKGERIGLYSNHPLLPTNYIVDDVYWDSKYSPSEPPVVELHAEDRDPNRLKLLEKIENIKDLKIVGK